MVEVKVSIFGATALVNLRKCWKVSGIKKHKRGKKRKKNKKETGLWKCM